MHQLEQELAGWLKPHQDVVQRSAGVGRGLGAADYCRGRHRRGMFPSEKSLASWVGKCPGEQQSAQVNKSHRSPKAIVIYAACSIGLRIHR